MPICPRCRKEYKEPPAISRRDNETEICSKCGGEETVFDLSIRGKIEEERKWLGKDNEKFICPNCYSNEAKSRRKINEHKKRILERIKKLQRTDSQ
jgi:predicted RNA-binding Zn-ribbon protein involved in translation (DUF1610 family)